MVLGVAVLPASNGCSRPAPEVVASYRGGEITFADVERELQGLPEAQRLRADLDVLETYGQLSRQIALERHFESRAAEGVGDDEDSATTSAEVAPVTAANELEATRLADLPPRRVAQEIARLYAAELLAGETAPVPGDEEVAQRYEQQRDTRFAQRGRVLLSTLLVRDVADEGGWERTRELLEQLRASAAAGEPFTTLARTYSESETAPLGGEVGWIDRGTLPPELEEIAFALAEGEVSQPIRVAGGGMLLHVAQRVEDAVFPLSQVAAQIRAELIQERRDEWIEQWVERQEAPPEGSIVWARPEVEALAGELAPLDQATIPAAGGGSPVELEPDQEHDAAEVFGLSEAQAYDEPGGGSADAQLSVSPPILRLGDVTLSREELERRLRRVPQGLRAAAAWRHYRELQTSGLLAVAAERSGFADRPEVVSRVRRRLEAEERRRRFASELSGEVGLELDRLLVEGDAGRGPVREFFEQRRDEYRSETSFDLIAFRAPDGGVSLARLESLRRRVASGEQLPEVVGALDGELVELGLLRFSELRGALDPKAVRHVLQMASVGVTPPLRIDGSLWLIQVLERRAPEPRSWEDAREAVRRDYRRMRSGELLTRTTDRLLDGIDFEFHADNVRQQLGLDAVAEAEADAEPGG